MYIFQTMYKYYENKIQLLNISISVRHNVTRFCHIFCLLFIFDTTENLIITLHVSLKSCILDKTIFTVLTMDVIDSFKKYHVDYISNVLKRFIL